MSGGVKEVSAEYQINRHSREGGNPVEVDDCPVGYKRNEIGVYPEDWSISQVSNVAQVVDSLHQTPSFSVDGYAMVRVADIKTGNLALQTTLKVSENVFKEFTRNYKPKKTDIVLSRVGSYGVSSYVNTDEDFCMGQNTVVIQSKITPKYLYYILNSDATWQQIEDGSYGSGYKSLSLKNINELYLPIPIEKEQTAIANALSDADALITSLEKLITKKRAIKTTAMQQLLTGKKRLPPFDKTHTGYKQTELGEIPEDWEVKRVNQLTSNIIDYRGVTPKKIGMEWGGGDIVALSAGNVKKGYIDFEAESYFGSEALYKRWMRNGDVKKGDVVFTMEAPLGNVAIIPDERKYILSQRTILLQFNRNVVSSMYLYQLIMSEEFQSNLSDKGTGSTAQGIKRATFELLELPLPSYEEQVLIADILADMDKEIETIEQRLTKTQQLKQGMMQELLTGRIRLI